MRGPREILFLTTMASVCNNSALVLCGSASAEFWFEYSLQNQNI